MNKNANKSVADLERQLAECSAQIAEERAYQDAIVEVLRVISESPTDLQPVFDVIVERARALCDAAWANTSRFDGEVLHLMSVSGRVDDTATELLRGAYPMKLDGAALPARAVASRTTVQVADLSADPSYNAQLKEMGRRSGLNSVLAVPMIRGDTVLGTILVSRAETGTFPDKFVNLLETFATQAVIAIDNVQQFNETQAALERQTATAEILRVISKSPNDVQPVFDAIAQRAMTLCGALGAAATRKDGDMLHAMATAGGDDVVGGLGTTIRVSDGLGYAFRDAFPTVISREGLNGRAVLERAPVQIPDIDADPELGEDFKQGFEKAGARSGLVVPMLQGNEVLGTIMVLREETGLFPDKLVSLLQTFADQAVIAIENVRLFNETNEALERQTATAEILQVISGSPTDVQPVFDAIAERAKTLCEALGSVTARFDGEMLHAMASAGDNNVVDGISAAINKAFPMPISRAGLNARAVLERTRVQIPDIKADSEYASTLRQGLEEAGARSALAVPMLRDDDVLGTIMVFRKEPGLFPDKLVQLLETFADQAVIAVENVRLFNETQNALERQTATAEILKTISASPTDVQPVFEAIAERAVAMSNALGCVTTRFDGELIHAMAYAGGPRAIEGLIEGVVAGFPMAPGQASASARAVADRATSQIPDIERDPEYAGPIKDRVLRTAGARSALAVPMIRDSEVLGTITLIRSEVGNFPDDIVTLVETFADQAVIAIENVRLFNETEEALERQTAISDILRVISESPTDVQPVFDAIASRAMTLCDAEQGATMRFDGERLHIASAYGFSPERIAIANELFPAAPSRATITGRAVLERAPVQIPDILADEEFKLAGAVEDDRSMLAVPLIREGEVIGAITVGRKKVGLFPGSLVSLLKTFADQAVIAIENVRLFNETEEALEQQTAISDVLRVISESPTDVQPVFDAIAERAMKLCGAEIGVSTRFDGELMHLAGAYGFSNKAVDGIRNAFPVVPGRDTISGRTFLERAPVQITDMQADREYGIQAAAAEAGSTLAVPLMREGEVIGSLAVARKKTGMFPAKLVSLLQTFADQAVIAIENVRLFNETEEALERQTAISDILRVISESPTNIQPVFDAITKSAVALCGADIGVATRVDGEQLQLVTIDGMSRKAIEASRAVFPVPIDRNTASGQAILDKAPVQLHHMDSDPEYRLKTAALEIPSLLAVPLVREGTMIGTIAVGRKQAGEFPEKQVKLLETFAGQAVIAIENVRLFNETQEALEQQTAVSDILRVTTESPTDEQPILESIADHAVELCDATSAAIYLIDDDRLKHVTSRGATAHVLAQIDSLTIDRTSTSGRAILDRKTVHVEDMQSEQQEYPLGYEIAKQVGHRTIVVAPLMREGQPFGTILLRREEVRPFSDREIALLRTFGDQAAIALQNVRLFNETKEALEQQTATADILKVISSSPTNLSPVFDAIADRARVLCNADLSAVGLFDGKHVDVAVIQGLSPEQEKTIRSHYPKIPDRGLPAERAIVDGKPIVVSDVLEDPEYRPLSPTREANARSVLAVPMLKEEKCIGSLIVMRKIPGGFPDKIVTLFQTFADQAVIAIENARLFNETNEALEQLTATAEVLRVISSSIEDTGPVFDKILDSCQRIFSTEEMFVNLIGDDGLFHYAAVRGEAAERVRNMSIPAGESLTARGIRENKTLHVPSVEDVAEMTPTMRAVYDITGNYSTVLAPMVRDGRGIGSISLVRHPPKPFTEKEISLLTTFADQAVIAIENARLFNETKEALEQQTATSEVLSVISSSVEDTAPVFDTIIERCTKLFRSEQVNIFRVLEDGQIDLAAARGEMSEILSEFYPRPLADTIHGLAIENLRPVHYSNVELMKHKPRDVQEIYDRVGNHSVMAAPMMWEGRGIGTIVVGDLPPRPFSDKEISVLGTFADQAVIAIQNARLINETREALEQQTATSDILKVISSSPTDLTPIFQEIADRGRELVGADISGVFLYDGKMVDMPVSSGASPALKQKIHTQYPMAPFPAYPSHRAIIDRAPVQVVDLQHDPIFEPFPPIKEENLRSALGVPLMKEGNCIGSIAVLSTKAGGFSDKIVQLFQTFADQAVIAIENARLFNETKEALEQQTATAEVLRVISRSVEDTAPVFEKILDSCRKLFAAEQLNIALVGDDGQLHLAAHRGEWMAKAAESFPMPLENTVTGIALTERRPVHYPSVDEMTGLPDSVSAVYKEAGNFSIAIAPMILEKRAVGSLIAARIPPKRFTDKEISLLTTFADQAVIAIENARLFREIEEKSQQLEIANQHKSEFLANMSHELRTPLNAIIGFSEVLLERMFGELNDKQDDYLKDIYSSGKHLLALINDILDLSKIEAGRMELDLEVFDVAGALENAMTLVRERAQQHGIALTLDAEQVNGEMRADERKLKQIMLNLLSNAVKFTPDGGSVSVRARLDDQRLEVAVSDTGIGISEQDQDAIFEEFQQVGGDYTNKQEGTGLGLSLTRRFVELHGGELSLTSELEKGSTFTFTLPRQS